MLMARKVLGLRNKVLGQAAMQKQVKVNVIVNVYYRIFGHSSFVGYVFRSIIIP